ncbi:50S rRNA methyltransferase [Bacteroidetes bacterium UKL13-3]|nr:50S rRNA methyltransferase [Bacteroidetes bacterium UKL13-3]HCP93267.1 23S rRNA (adenine(2503)-C(2))-methyltransferase RlmN [Bacteroidota bacterium]
MNTASKKDIRSLSLSELKESFAGMGEKPFRGQQVYEWIWKKSARSFSEMSNLSKELREKLELNYTINAVSVDEKQISSDGTIKNSLKLFDGPIVEGVLIPTEKRITACVSSQVGCSLSCRFCATGKLDLARNLNADEIYDEVVIIKNQAEQYYQRPLTNIVFMGMGEPLLNYRNVLGAIAKITGEDGLNMASDRITVSTAGIAKMIKKLGDDEVKFNLALSLHAANDEKRSKIMPINESNTLDVLGEALAYYYSKTKNQVTFEYIVFKDFNDTLKDADELLAFSKYVPSKVNLIEYNSIDGGEFQNTSGNKLYRFQRYLEDNGLTATLRRSRGKDIDAACGQLANKRHKEAVMGE